MTPILGSFGKNAMCPHVEGEASETGREGRGTGRGRREGPDIGVEAKRGEEGETQTGAGRRRRWRCWDRLAEARAAGLRGQRRGCQGPARWCRASPQPAVFSECSRKAGFNTLRSDRTCRIPGTRPSRDPAQKCQRRPWGRHTAAHRDLSREAR